MAVSRGMGAFAFVCLVILLVACNGGGKHTVSVQTNGATGATSPAAAASSGSASPAAKDERIDFSKAGWKTDFSRHSVPLSEISSGGPPRDGIPPLDHPRFVSIPEGDGFLNDVEPVIAFEHRGDARAYPIQVLIWHEIVNDTVSGLPVTVTFCPLCNTAIAFDRALDGRVLDFGTTGNLRDSDLVMWDRQTESWWQQFTGTAIVGELTGKQLDFLPAAIVSWAEFKQAYPSGQALSKETGFDRPYGSNPYAGYDNAHDPPFLFSGKPDGRLLPKERVVTVALGGEAVAYPFATLAKLHAVNDMVGGRPVVVFWHKGTVSPLDREKIVASSDVGSATVYRAELDGHRLTFKSDGDTFVDQETGSRWTLLGRGVAGPLAGKQLEPLVHANPFWFAAAAANPGIRIFQP